MYKEIVLGSQNKNKLSEILASAEILNIKNIKFTLASAYTDHNPKETGASFEENALIKAQSLYKLLKKPILSDDSGLSITQLNDQPGIYSSRLAGSNKDYSIAIHIIRKMLILSDPFFETYKNIINKTTLNLVNSRYYEAKFICTLCFYNGENNYKFFTSILRGAIKTAPSGSNGFAYDTIFIPSKEQETLAQMSPQKKNTISHRRKALEQFLQYIVAYAPNN